MRAGTVRTAEARSTESFMASRHSRDSEFMALQPILVLYTGVERAGLCIRGEETEDSVLEDRTEKM